MSASIVSCSDVSTVSNLQASFNSVWRIGNSGAMYGALDVTDNNCVESKGTLIWVM